MTSDREWFIQKAIAWWLRDLSKRDAPRVQTFLDQHGAQMKSFAWRGAGRLLPQDLNTSSRGRSVSDTPSNCRAGSET